jgi:hypothetical protein
VSDPISDSDSDSGDDTFNVDQNEAVSSLETAGDYIWYLPEHTGLKIKRLERQQYKMITHIKAQKDIIASDRIKLEADMLALIQKYKEKEEVHQEQLGCYEETHARIVEQIKKVSDLTRNIEEEGYKKIDAAKDYFSNLEDLDSYISVVKTKQQQIKAQELYQFGTPEENANLSDRPAPPIYRTQEQIRAQELYQFGTPESPSSEDGSGDGSEDESGDRDLGMVDQELQGEGESGHGEVAMVDSEAAQISKLAK